MSNRQRIVPTVFAFLVVAAALVCSHAHALSNGTKTRSSLTADRSTTRSASPDSTLSNSPSPDRTETQSPTRDRSETQSPTPDQSRSLSYSSKLAYAVNITNNTGLVWFHPVRDIGSGRVVVSGPAGTCCSSGWSTNAAVAVCALAGFTPTPTTATLSTINNMPPNWPSYLLPNAACPSAAATTHFSMPSQCTWSAPAACNQNTDIAVSCYSNAANLVFNQTLNGVIMVSPNVSDTPVSGGFVCRYPSANGATPVAMCNLAGGGGYVTATSAVVAATAPPGAFPLLADFSCTGSTIGTCSYFQNSPRVIRKSSGCAATTDALSVNCYTQQSNWIFAIETGDGSNRLTAKHNSTAALGTVCSTGFTNATSLFFCRNARVDFAVRAYYAVSTISGGAATPVVLSNMASCPYYATSIASCAGYVQNTPELPRTTCAHADDVAVFCFVDRRNFTFMMNLTNGTVLLRDVNDVASEWGTVCNKPTLISTGTAQVMCRLLKWPGTVTSATASSVQTANLSAPVYADSIDCQSSAAIFQNCSYDNTTTCAHTNNDIAVNCHISPSSWTWNQSVYSGAIRVKPPGGSWGTVCNVGGIIPSITKVTALAVCRFLGWVGSDAFNVTIRTAPPVDQLNGSTIFFTDLACPGGASSLSFCLPNYVEAAEGAAFQRSSCNHSGDLAIDCYRPASQWNFSQDVTTGYLYANYTSSAGPPSRQGTVCSATDVVVPGTTSAAALGLCGLLGWTKPTEVSTSFGSTAAPALSAGRPILISNLTCDMGAATTSLDNCTYLESLATGSMASRTFCTHADDIVVNYCHNDRATWQAMQVPGSSVVQVRPSSASPWGSVCHKGAALVESAAELQAKKNVMCRLLGWNFAPIHNSTSLSFSGSMPLAAPAYMSNLSCAVSADDLFSCNYSESSSRQDRTGCTHTTDMLLDCRTDPRSFEFRIDYISGRLETRPNSTGPWGSVCANNAAEFSDTTALAFCRMLGMPQATFARVGTPRLGTSVAGLASVPIYLQNVSCPTGSITSLADCEATYIQSDAPPLARTSCGHDRDVAIYCYSPTASWHFESLTGSGANRIRARPNSSAPWGAMCAVGAGNLFDSTGINATCNMLKYPGKMLSAAASMAAAPASDLIYLSDLRCSIPATSLASCSYNQSDNNRYYHTCAASQALSLVCKSDPATFRFYLAYQGAALYVSANGALGSENGTVCGTGLDGNTEMAMCNMLGWHNAVQATTTVAAPTLPAAPVLLEGLSCPANTTSSNGTNGIHPGCAYSQFTSVAPSACALGASQVNLTCRTNPVKWQVMMGANDIVLVRPGSKAPWGTVCGRGVTYEGAATLCHMLGIKNIESMTIWNASTRAIYAGALPQYLADVICPTNVTYSLASCSYVEGGSATLLHPVVNCSHDMDLAMICVNGTSHTQSPSKSASPSESASSSESRSRRSPSRDETSASRTLTESRTLTDSRSLVDTLTRARKPTPTKSSKSRTDPSKTDTPRLSKSATLTRTLTLVQPTTPTPTTTTNTTTTITTTITTTTATTTTTTGAPTTRRTRTRTATVALPTTTTTVAATTVMPTLAAPVPVAQQAVVSTGSAVAASVAAPAAAQTLRAMTLLGVIDTAERCRLQSFGTDTYASDPRSFPESFFPSIRIAGPNATVDALFGLPSRRGAIVANAIIGPMVIFAIAALCGVVRKRFAASMKDASPLAAGRVLGVTAAVTGSLAMDGVFASSVVLLTVPGAPPGGDVALALFGMLIVTAIPVAIGAMMYRVIQREVEAGHPIECVPAVVCAKNADAEATAAAKPARGALWFLFGTETWVGPTEAFEQYRPIFASNRGNSAATTKEWKSSKVFRCRLATWSFFLDCLMTAVAATGRGWATTLPCTANRKVQLMQFLIAVVAFIFSVVVQPAISPLRRAVDMASGFVMTMGTFALAVLGAESGAAVTQCALASAFMATVSTLVLVLARHVVLPLRGLAICPATAAEDASALGEGLLVLPLLGGDDSEGVNYVNDLGNGDAASTMDAAGGESEIDVELEMALVASEGDAGDAATANRNQHDVWADLAAAQLV